MTKYKLEWRAEDDPTLKTGTLRLGTLGCVQVFEAWDADVGRVAGGPNRVGDSEALGTDCIWWLGEALAAIAEGRGRVWKSGDEAPF